MTMVTQFIQCTVNTASYVSALALRARSETLAPAGTLSASLSNQPGHHFTGVTIFFNQSI